MAPKGKKFVKDKKTNNSDGKLSLPRISGANASSTSSNPPTFRGRNTKKPPLKKDAADDSTTPASTMGIQNYDPKKALTVELQVSWVLSYHTRPRDV